MSSRDIAKEAAEKIIALMKLSDEGDGWNTDTIEQIILAAMERDDQGLAEWLCRDVEDQIIVTTVFNGADPRDDRFYTRGVVDDYNNPIMIELLTAAIASYRGRVVEHEMPNVSSKQYCGCVWGNPHTVVTCSPDDCPIHGTKRDAEKEE